MDAKTRKANAQHVVEIRLVGGPPGPFGIAIADSHPVPIETPVIPWTTPPLATETQTIKRGV